MRRNRFDIFRVFPLQLFISHAVNFPLLLLPWIVIIGLSTSYFGNHFGLPSIILSPEYFGTVSPLSFAMLGIGIDTSIASANEVETAIAQQGESHSENSAPKQEVVTEVVENIMDKAVDYVKSSTDKKKAYESIVKKYGDQMTKNQLAGLKKFVR